MPLAAGRDHAFAEYGLPGEPGTDTFWAAARTPLSVPGGDGGWRTLFLWRGSPATVEFEGWSQPVALRRRAGTDCWYAEVPMPARLRVTYQLRSEEGAFADPYNPVGAGGDRSLAASRTRPPSRTGPPSAPTRCCPSPRAGALEQRPARRAAYRTPPSGGRRRAVGPAARRGRLALSASGRDRVRLGRRGRGVAAGHPGLRTVQGPGGGVRVPARSLGGDTRRTAAPGGGERRARRPGPAGGRRAEPRRAERAVRGAGVPGAGLPRGLSVAVVLVGARGHRPPGPAGRSARRDDRRAAARAASRTVRSALRVRPGGTRDADAAPRRAGRGPGGGAGAAVRVSRSPAGHDRVGWRHALLRDVAWALG